MHHLTNTMKQFNELSNLDVVANLHDLRGGCVYTNALLNSPWNLQGSYSYSWLGITYTVSYKNVGNISSGAASIEITYSSPTLSYKSNYNTAWGAKK
jgi:hypothetical protein